MTRAAAATSTAGVAAMVAAMLCVAPAHATPPLGAGIPIATEKGDCTIGLIIAAPETGTTRGVTAGHCVGGPNGIGQTVIVPTDDDKQAIAGRVSSATDLNNLDYATIDFDTTAPATTRIATPGKPGAPVCKLGSTTGRTCGHIVKVTATEIIADALVRWGDSGGPLLDTTGAVIGIVSRAVDTRGSDIIPAMLTNSLRVVYPRADRIVDQQGKAHQ